MKSPSSDPSLPLLKQLVLIGGGHSHLFVLASLAMNPIPGLRVLLVSKDSMTGYSGMLPGYIAGHYDFDETHIDLRRLAEYAGVTFIQDEVLSLDPEAQRIRCRRRGEIAYDWCSINTGSTPSLPPGPDHGVRGVPVKPIDRFLRYLGEVEQRIERGEPGDAPVDIAVVGAGAAGTEVVLALQERFQSVAARRGSGEAVVRFHLVSASAEILPLHNEKVRAMMARILAERGVQVHAGFRVSEWVPGERGNVLLGESGEQLQVDEVIYTTGARAADWLAEAGLPLDEGGFVKVSPSLQTLSYANVFAAGDVANIEGHPTEKAGVFAVRQGKPLAHNIRALIEGKPLRAYRPQKKWLALLTTGDRYAIASRGKLALEGTWVWRWKDHIDRKFMQMFQDLPAMPPVRPPALPAALRSDDNSALVENLGMRCAGCGSKVGDSVLRRALAELEQPPCEGVEVGLAAPDDAAVIAVPEGQYLVQSLDYFTAITDDPWLQGRIAAVHALGDVYAMGAKPHSALAMVSLPLGAEAVMGEMLQQVLAGALTVFGESQACIVGGHTTEAETLSVGFAVNAFVDPGKVLHKQGLVPGDVLVLTKPIGTGVLFAAHAQLQAKGEWLDMALASMSQSNAVAAGIIAEHGAHACTDVTGFGLMGHLVEMLRGTEQGVELHLRQIATLPGALELSEQGVRSSLFPENFKARHRVENLDEVFDTPHFALLFDPQTAGGLMAGVPASRLQSCLRALRRAGYPAVAIGRVVQREQGGEDVPALVRVECD